MSENNTGQQVDMNFLNFVLSLSQTALVGMGKISNPQTGKVEKNMGLSRINIDILEMLKEKTRGNLTDKEKEVLFDTLTNLQLTYADEKKKETTEAPEEKDLPDDQKREENVEEQDVTRQGSGDVEEGEKGAGDEADESGGEKKES